MTLHIRENFEIKERAGEKNVNAMKDEDERKINKEKRK